MSRPSPIERIHHIDPAFNRLFDRPLYFAGFLVTALAFVSPYWLRSLTAFAINVFFNRPVVYATLAAEKVGKRLSALAAYALYFTLFGAYAIAYRMLGAGRRPGGWSPMPDQPEEGWSHQS